MPNSLLSTCKIFADDTKLYTKASNSHMLQNDIYKLQDWSKKWNLYSNVSKCKVMHIGRNNPGCDYVMNLKDGIQSINTCVEEKDLGVNFDYKFTFDPHVLRIVNKANQMIGIIKRGFHLFRQRYFYQIIQSFRETPLGIC